MTVKELIQKLSRVDGELPVEVVSYFVTKVNDMPEKVGSVEEDFQIVKMGGRLVLMTGDSQ